jgi:hypothetical protein
MFAMDLNKGPNKLRADFRDFPYLREANISIVCLMVYSSVFQYYFQYSTNKAPCDNGTKQVVLLQPLK